MSQAKGSWMRMAVLAGALAFSSGAAAQTASPQTHATGGERGADGRQRRDADRVLEARPVAAAERAQRSSSSARAITRLSRLKASRS